ncbi:hypothetical protein BSLA_02f4033 [Burkholderia stabilis]|nr:hypothetical protein BSLA_02f4033 [Burkholderia stabilis]
MNLAAVCTDHPVQRDRLVRRLLERHPLAAAHAEVLPIRDQLVRVLVDRHRLVVRRRRDVRLAPRDRTTRRQRVCARRHCQPQQRHARREQALAAARLTATARRFPNRAPAALRFVPYQ